MEEENTCLTSHDRNEKSDNDNAQERERAALERGVAEIKTPDQARRSLDSLEKAAGDLREEDVASAMPKLAGAAGCGHRGGRGRSGGRESGQRDRGRGCPVRECRTR